MGELIVTGCEDGVLILHGDHFHKVSSPDAFGRIGNLFAFEGSDYLLGDYKTDAEDGINLTDIAIINTTDETMSIVETGSEYTWRGLARGMNGEMLVLGTDGKLRVFSETGELEKEIDVIEAWEAPSEWQSAHPALAEHEGYAYITEPSTKKLYQVNYTNGEIVNSVELAFETNEITLVTGELLANGGAANGDTDHHDHGDHDHEHDHDDHEHDDHDH